MSTRIINDTFLLNGMPCHKYILRNLTTSVDAIVFRKTYVNTMLAAGALHEEIEASIPLLSIKLDPNSPIAGYDFYATVEQKNGLSFVDSICFDDDVTTHRKCDQFYKKFDKKAVVCRLCPLSDKYRNRNFQLERTVLAYALSSPTAFQYLLDHHVTADHFESVIDIMEYFSYAQKASCYPLFSQTFVALQNPEIHDAYFISKENGTEPVDLVAFHDENLTNHYIPRGFLSADMTARLENVLAEEIKVGVCPADSEIDALIAQLTNRTTTPQEDSSLSATLKYSTQIAAHSNMGLDTLDSFYETPPMPRRNQKVSKKNVRKQGEPLLATAHEQLSLTDVLLHSSTGTLQYDHIQDAEIVNALPGKSSFYYGVPEEHIRIREIPESSSEKKDAQQEGTNQNMVTIPMVSTEELTNFALPLDTENVRLLSIFESSVLKQKNLSLELIQTEDNNVYLLMYSSRMRAYLYTDLSSAMVREILSPILEHTSITKYCYYPFAMLSALWKSGIYVKGIYSLFSMSAVCFDNHHMHMGTTLEKLGAIKAVAGLTIKPCGEIKSIPMNYVHDYNRVYSRIRYTLLKRGIYPEYEQRNHFDRALSYSYYQDHRIEQRDTLFTLRTASRYYFHSGSTKPLPEYVLLQCIFKNRTSFPTPLVRDIILRLEKTGQFRKWNIILTNVSSNALTICIQKRDYKKITTILNTTILSYLLEQEWVGLEYHLEQL
ncbi:MAG: hypothetical protein IKB01_08705 [Lachnospiraceae bacterium]|nr:hypothetical protein [Lachnospiraceae bacterium]